MLFVEEKKREQTKRHRCAHFGKSSQIRHGEFPSKQKNKLILARIFREFQSQSNTLWNKSASTTHTESTAFGQSVLSDRSSSHALQADPACNTGSGPMDARWLMFECVCQATIHRSMSLLPPHSRLPLPISFPRSTFFDAAWSTFPFGQTLSRDLFSSPPPPLTTTTILTFLVIILHAF